MSYYFVGWWLMIKLWGPCVHEPPRLDFEAPVCPCHEDEVRHCSSTLGGDGRVYSFDSCNTCCCTQDGACACTAMACHSGPLLWTE